MGPCRNKKDLSRTGGVIVLFEAWIQYCDEQKINATTIDTNKANYANLLIAYIFIIYQFIKKVRRHTIVMLHGTANDYLYIVPVVVFISKLYHCKVVLRKFAGNFEEIYNQSNVLKKKIYNYILRNSDIQFWETKSLVRFGEKAGTKSLWFPNTRTDSTIKRPTDKPYQRRFVFISRVDKNKGIDNLIKCFESLPNDYTVDIYGPIKGYETSQLNGNNFRYVKPLKPADVCKELSHYDVVVLPTLWKAEGYPGIIIEGYSVGLPTIASNIGAIPEIVEDKKTGFLIRPGNIEDFRKAILSIDENNYKTLSSNARKAFNMFDERTINNKILNYVML